MRRLTITVTNPENRMIVIKILRTLQLSKNNPHLLIEIKITNVIHPVPFLLDFFFTTDYRDAHSVLVDASINYLNHSILYIQYMAQNKNILYRVIKDV